jgi:hypothetical protein
MSLVTDYVAVSNTNIYLRAGVGGPVRLLASFPPGYRLMERGSATPWFPGWPVYRQRSCGDWSEALGTLAVDVTAAYGSAEGGP